MDPVSDYREAVERVLTLYTQIPYAHGELRCEVVFDREHDRYALITLGWQAGKRVHFALVHIDIVGGGRFGLRKTTPKMASPRNWFKPAFRKRISCLPSARQK
jgi:hypothetical protein